MGCLQADRHQGSVIPKCDQRTQLIVPTDDVDGNRNERGLAERYGEAHAPTMRMDIHHAQGAASVLSNAKQAVEGKQASTPVAGIGEAGCGEVRTELA